MKTIIRFQTCILAAGSDKRSKRSGSTIQVQRKQSIIVTFFYNCTNVYNTMCKFKVTKTEIKMGYMERDKTHQVLTFKSVY